MEIRVRKGVVMRLTPNALRKSSWGFTTVVKGPRSSDGELGNGKA